MCISIYSVLTLHINNSRLTEDQQRLSQAAQSSDAAAKRASITELIPLQQERDRLQSVLEATQAHVQFLQDELQSQTLQNQKLNQEHRDGSVQNQMQLAQVLLEKEALEARHQALIKIQQDLQTSIQDLSKDLLEQKQTMTDQHESHQLEVVHLNRLIQAHEAQNAQFQGRCRDLQGQCEALQKGAAQASLLAQEEKKQLRQELEAKYQEMNESYSGCAVGKKIKMGLAKI